MSTHVVPANLLSFVTRFYKISDAPGGHIAYADCLTDNASCSFSGALHTGRENIIKMREGMWEKIALRDHHPEKVFLADDGRELVVWGKAYFTPKVGEPFKTLFFARMVLEDPNKHEEDLLMTFYEVVKRQ